jgi:two-component system LytT family response regulator
MITAIIIDDEQKGRMSLKQKLGDYCSNVQLIGEADNGEEGIRLIEKHHPRIVFLDIEMPRMDGFEMLQRLHENDFHLIFTTAYDHYAIKAIKYAAFDYLLKPIDIEELQATIANIDGKKKNQVSMQVELLQQSMQQPKKQLNKLAIPTLDGLLFYDINEIVHLEANSNYTNIHLLNRTKIIASKTLKEFEELLPDDIFFRTHHSHLINLNFIVRYIKGDGGQIELQNGTHVEVSRRKKEEFLKITRHL